MAQKLKATLNTLILWQAESFTQSKTEYGSMMVCNFLILNHTYHFFRWTAACWAIVQKNSPFCQCQKISLTESTFL